MNNSERTIEILKEIQDALPTKFDNMTRTCENPAIYRLLYLTVLHSHAVPEYYPAVLAIASYGKVILNEDGTITFGLEPITSPTTDRKCIIFESNSGLAEGWRAKFLIDLNGRSIGMLHDY